MTISVRESTGVATASEHVAAPRDGGDERPRLLRDAVLNASGILISSAVALLVVPIMLRGLGAAAYGLWIAVSAVVAIAVSFDLGLGWTVVRQIAADSRGEPKAETVQFFQAAANAYLVLGVLSGAVLWIVGLVVAYQMPFSPELRAVAPFLFAMAGIGLVGERMTAFAVAVLHGMRRFGSAVMLVSGFAILRGVGIAMLLWNGGSVREVAVWHTGAALVSGAAGMLLLASLRSGFRMAARAPIWRSLRSHAEFGLASQFTSVATGLTWQAGALVVGALAGAPAIVPLHIGQRFPLFADGIGWRAAEVAFPAAGQEGNREAGEEILLATTRSTLLVVLPLCIVMAVIAPSLLQVWLGFADPATVSVLQITAAAVLVDALGVGAIHVLWGKGRARVVLAIVGSVAVGTWILTYMLVPRWGVAGAALGLGLALLAGTIAALELAARACRASALSVVFHAIKGAATPAVLCAAIAYVSVQSFTSYNWTFILLVSGAAGAAYLVSLSAFGLHPEERAMVKHAARFWGRTDRRSPQPLFRLRQRLKRVGPLHSLWHLLLDLRETIIDTPTRARIEFDELHRQRSDPWSYLTIPARGEERFRRADEMLDIIGGPCRRALEVGCSEGLYTRRLAARCDSVLAVDISATALVRAREFCRNLAHVEFREWDLRREELEGDFDLIVAMGVLESFGWPRHLAVARRKLIEMLRPGGWLLVETTRVNPEMEHLWWRRALNRERWLNEFVGEDPRLVTVSSVIDPAAARTLFQKKEA